MIEDVQLVLSVDQLCELQRSFRIRASFRHSDGTRGASWDCGRFTWEVRAAVTGHVKGGEGFGGGQHHNYINGSDDRDKRKCWYSSAPISCQAVAWRHFSQLFLQRFASQNPQKEITDMRRLTTGIRSEKCVVRRFRRCANLMECTYINLDSTDMRRLTTEIHSEKCVVRRFRRCANVIVYLQKPR